VTAPHRDSVRIVRLADCGLPSAVACNGIDAIFWETVLRAPTGDAEREAFYDLWLGQYLRLDPRDVFVALNTAGFVGGYLVGCRENPATSPRFSSLPYFQTFADACARYPGHLHLNLTAAWRGWGIGGCLITAFEMAASAAGLTGIHVVTGAGSRNVTFYARAGFKCIDRTQSAADRGIVFLGRDLTVHR
jgi:GNAT superfamily N-acetyltransferase